MPGHLVGIDLDAFRATCAQVGAEVSVEEARALLLQRGFQPDEHGRWFKTVRLGPSFRKTRSASPRTSHPDRPEPPVPHLDSAESPGLDREPVDEG